MSRSGSNSTPWGRPQGRTRRGGRAGGFTLLELTVSMALLVIISILTFVVTNSTTEAVSVSETKEIVQAAVRDAMAVMTAELQLASKTSNAALTPPLDALEVSDEDYGELTFQVPLDASATQWSAPITYHFVNEDDHEGDGAHNGRLDDGEDLDEDGALTRRIVRIQDGVETPLGAVNDLSAVTFLLNTTSDVLTITLTASRPLLERDSEQVWAQATSSVYLLN